MDSYLTAQCDTRTSLANFTIEILALSTELPHVKFLFEHPEDLGSAAKGNPALVFQLDRLHDENVQRGENKFQTLRKVCI